MIALRDCCDAQSASASGQNRGFFFFPLTSIAAEIVRRVNSQIEARPTWQSAAGLVEPHHACPLRKSRLKFRSCSTYNRRHSLPRAIASVHRRAARDSNWASATASQSTHPCLPRDAVRPRIRVITSTATGGPARHATAVLQRARDSSSFLDSDSTYRPGPPRRPPRRAFAADTGPPPLVATFRSVRHTAAAPRDACFPAYWGKLAPPASSGR